FSAEDMGSSENGGTSGRGFTEMENVMLDLAGGTGDPMSATFGGGGALIVGPTTEATVGVDPALIGADTEQSGAYFTPDAKLYRKETGQETSEQDHRDLPDLVDAWGTPVLAWRRNEFGPTQITD